MFLIFLRRFWVALFVLLITLAVGFASLGFYFHLNYCDAIAPNVFVGTVNLSGLSKTQAKIELEKKFGKVPSKKVVYFSYHDYRQAGLERNWSLNSDDINLTPKNDEAVNLAFQVAHEKNLLDRIPDQFFVLLKRKKITLNWDYDERKVNKFIDSIADELAQDPKDAEIKFEDGKLKIVPGTEGKVLDVAKLKAETKKGLKDGKPVNLALSLETVKPSITTEQLNSLERIAIFNTPFDFSDEKKLEEIERSISAINKVLLASNEEFSFLTTLDEEIPEDTEGGYSQVAATLYNAALLTNLDIKDRYPNIIPPDYVPIGRDALVANGKDLSFINSTDSYIYIAAYVDDSQIVVEIYGSSSAQKIDLKVEIEKISPTLEEKKDPLLLAGERFVEKKERVGYKTVVLRVFSVGSEEVGSEEISKDVYPAQDGIVLIGTGEATAGESFIPKGIEK